MEKKDLDFSKLTELAMKVKVSDIAPTELKANLLSQEKITEIIVGLATSHGISEQDAFVAIILLFLKGAANNGAPNTMGVTIVDTDKNHLVITKNDLKYSYQRATGNEFIRRLAESLAEQIGKYAEKNFLIGDIAQKIDSRILINKEDKDRIPLSQKEKAWASSFSQCLPNLSELSSTRLPQLLAADYYERFQKNKKAKKEIVSPKTVKEKAAAKTYLKVHHQKTN